MSRLALAVGLSLLSGCEAKDLEGEKASRGSSPEDRTVQDAIHMLRQAALDPCATGLHVSSRSELTFEVSYQPKCDDLSTDPGTGFIYSGGEAGRLGSSRKMENIVHVTPIRDCPDEPYKSGKDVWLGASHGHQEEADQIIEIMRSFHESHQ